MVMQTEALHLRLFALYQREQPEPPEKRIFELREVVHGNGHISHVWEEPSDFAYDMPPLEPLETLIKLDVVEVIVVTFRQEQLVFWLRLQPHALHFLRHVVRLEDTMHDRDVLSWYLVHRNIAILIPRIRWVGEEKEIAAVEGGLHRAAQNDDDWRLCVREETKSFPYHESGSNDGGEVEHLKQNISYPQFAHGFQCVTKHSETTTGNVARGQKDFTNEGGKQDDAAKLDRD